MNPAIAQFIPLLLIIAVQAAVAWPIVKRKGFGIGTFALCCFPSLGFLVLLWVASCTDKEVLERLASLEGREQ